MLRTDAMFIAKSWRATRNVRYFPALYTVSTWGLSAQSRAIIKIAAMFRALVFLVTSLMWQQPPPAVPAIADDPDVEFVCPMDKDVRSKVPGKCPRCGMTLVAGIPDAHEFPVRITTAPKIMKPGEETLLTFHIEDPLTSKTVRDFEIMHERLFHLFLISQDMQFFEHVHPIMQTDGTF